MAFAIALCFAYALYILNIGLVFKLEAVNAIEKLAFLFAAICFVMTRPVDRRVLVLLTIVMAMVLFLGSLTTYPYFQWTILINALNQFIIIYLLIAARPSARDAKIILLLIAFAPVASSMLGIAYDVVGLRPMFGAEFANRAERFRGSLIPSFLSGLAMCGVIACVLLVLRRGARYVPLGILNLSILVLAGGRSALAVALAVSGLSLAFARRISFTLKYAFFVGGCLIISFVLLLTWDTLSTRFTSSGMSGRDIMWAYLVNLADDYFWTGIGYGHQFFTTPRAMVVSFGSAAAHNDYYRLAVELGYPGMVMFYLLLTLAMYFVWSGRLVQRDPSVLIAYLGFLMLSITENVLSSPAYFPLLIVTIAATAIPMQVQVQRKPVARPQKAGSKRHGFSKPARLP